MVMKKVLWVLVILMYLNYIITLLTNNYVIIEGYIQNIKNIQLVIIFYDILILKKLLLKLK